MSISDSTPIDPAVKTCSKCGETKALGEFYPAPNSRWADRMHPWCKPCKAAFQKTHRHRTKSALPEAMTAAAPRLFRRVVKCPDTGCWELHGATDKKGYARMNVAGHNVAAYMVAFVAVYGDVERQVVMHSCDNPKCVNPEHLSPGTYHQNNADMWARGRGVGQRKLTDGQVKEIRELCDARVASQDRIASMYGVTQAVIHRIKTRKSYRWVKED